MPTLAIVTCSIRDRAELLHMPSGNIFFSPVCSVCGSESSVSARDQRVAARKKRSGPCHNGDCKLRNCSSVFYRSRHIVFKPTKLIPHGNPCMTDAIPPYLGLPRYMALTDTALGLIHTAYYSAV